VPPPKKMDFAGIPRQGLRSISEHMAATVRSTISPCMA
jgi:hypothetical protein